VKTRQLLRMPDVVKTIGRPKPSIYLMISRGLFPKPVHLSARVSAWPSDEVDAVVAAFVAGRSEEQIKELVKTLEQTRKAAAA